MAFSSRNNWEKVCSTLGRINETSAKQSDPIEIVGCGGGGATVVRELALIILIILSRVIIIINYQMLL